MQRKLWPVILLGLVLLSAAAALADGDFYGIYASGGVAHRIINVRAEDNSHGINLYGTGHLIQGCRATASSSSQTGLYIQTNGRISGCTTNNFVTGGIEIDGPGIIRDNVVIGAGTGSDYFGGIYAGGATLVKGNQVTGATRCIYCSDAASVIGNTVTISSDQYGISVVNAATTMVDQNNVIVAPSSTGFTSFTAHNLVAWRTNFYPN